jgi:hypothetical protein
MAALACLVLTGCAGAGGNPQLASGENSPPKVDSAAAETAAAGSAAALAADPALLRRRRQVIAEMLEGQPAYRNIFWAQLIDAKLAGPFEHTDKSIFTTASRTLTMYCASARYSALGVSTLPIDAVIRVIPLSNGFERLEARRPGIFECNNPNYEPFPELEQARAQRRKRMGKSD